MILSCAADAEGQTPLTAEVQRSKTRLWLEKLVELTATILVWNGSPKS